MLLLESKAMKFKRICDEQYFDILIKLYKKDKCIVAEFRNYYNDKNNNFNMGLDFCRELAILTKINLKFSKTKDIVCVKLKIPTLKNLKR